MICRSVWYSEYGGGLGMAFWVRGDSLSEARVGIALEREIPSFCPK